jgi:uncharacterized protein YgbK (DUF1537 family)
MKRRHADVRLIDILRSGAKVVSLDVLDEETLIEAGRLVWERDATQIFAVGSQGVEAALAAYWHASGLLPKKTRAQPVGRVDRIACVSGSVSPVTASQIAYAIGHGFSGIRIDASRAVDHSEWEAEIAHASSKALRALSEGSSPLVFTATGPTDPAVTALSLAVATAGVSVETVNDRIGTGLGRILDAVVREAKLTRAVISGGDTSSHAASMLGIDALTAIAPMAPGSPLCRAHSTDPDRDGLEIALKGGQVGGESFFCAVRDGTSHLN